MEEWKEIIKELKVDWDTTLHEGFNPLHLTLRLNANPNLSADFRDMQHRLGASMDRIIATNFRGFSESLGSFTAFRNKNREILEALDMCADECKSLREHTFDSTHVHTNTEYGRTDGTVLRTKYEVSRQILEARNLFQTFLDTDDLIKRSSLIARCLEILNEPHMAQIRGVLEYSKTVQKHFHRTVAAVNQRILGFVFRNELDSLIYFKALINLRSLVQLDECCRSEFDQHVFQEMETTILDAPRGCDLETLCHEVGRKADSIMENMEMVVKKCQETFSVDHEKDFFGKKRETYFVMSMEQPLEAVKNGLRMFISRYTVQESAESMRFDIDSVVDSVDYLSIYDNDSLISTRLCRECRVPSSLKKNYTVVSPPGPETVGFLSESLTNTNLKLFLRQFAEEHYFSELSLERNVFLVDTLLAGADMKDIPEEFQKIVKACKSFEEERKIRTHFKRSLLLHLLDEYDRLFVSEFVKRPEFYSFATKCKELNSGRLDPSSLSTADLVTRFDDFKDFLVKRHISKSELFLRRQKYAKVCQTMHALADLEDFVSCDEVRFLHQLYSESLRSQALLDFFYYFDLFYRQGNSQFYIRCMMDVLKIVFEETGGTECLGKLYEALGHYCVHNVYSLNVKSRGDLESFVQDLLILDEILGETGIYPGLNGLHTFFTGVLSGRTDTKHERILQQKIA